jgi:hypothetical protein
VEPQPVFETLPVLYRAVLDAVADLEARGYRRQAAAIRADATSTYSRAWTPAAAQRMHALRTRAARLADSGKGGRAVALDGLERIDVGSSTA